MPKRFDSGVFDPELARPMKNAFANAWAKVWAKVHVAPEDSAAASQHLAGAIVEMVGAGIRDGEQLTAGALVALTSAKGIVGEWMTSEITMKHRNSGAHCHDRFAPKPSKP
jgi:hypothetical protein